MVVNIRYPDASIYQSTTTDPNGDYSLNEVFPFFSYLIAEVDFGRYQATGMTAYIDDGGPLPNPGALLTPQIQPGGLDHRTETGVALLEAFTLYAGQTNRIDWGKNNYPTGKNGGISGIGYYATTRAEDDARYATADPWEPGIPRVQYSLYRDGLPAAPGVPAILPDGVPDDVDGDGVFTPADVDNDPLGNFPGPEDVDQNGDGLFDAGDAVNVVWSDSWDDKLPAGCVGPPDMYTFGNLTASECAETLRTWNQVVPGVFDGGYAFTTYFPKGMTSPDPANVETDIATGFYIVEVMPPPGYELVEGGGQERRLRRRNRPGRAPARLRGRPAHGSRRAVALPRRRGLLRRSRTARSATASRSGSRQARTPPPTSSSTPRCPRPRASRAWP